MPRRPAVLVAAVAVLVLAGGVGWIVLRGGERDCGIRTDAVDSTQPVFVGRAALVPAGSVGAEREPLVRAVDALPAPFGEVVSGRFYGDQDRVPQLVGDGDAVVLAEPPARPGGPTTLREVEPPEGEVRWARTLVGGAASGGPVGDRFVTAVGGADPTLLTVDASSGELLGCHDVPVARGTGPATVRTDQAGSDVVLVASRDGAASTLSVVDPEDGTVRLRTTLPAPDEVGSVSVVGGQAVVSRVGHDPVRLAELATRGGIPRPMVTAYSLDDGKPTWTYPRRSDPDTAPPGTAPPATAAAVMDTDPRTGATYVLAVDGAGGSPVSRLVALDVEGRTTWTSTLGRGFWDASTSGDLLLVQGPDPAGGAVLRALHRDDGSSAWTLHTRDYPGPRPALQRFGPATEVGGRLIMTTPAGLVLVDPATGRASAVRTSLRVDQVLPVGDQVLLRSGEALLVLDLDA